MRVLLGGDREIYVGFLIAHLDLMRLGIWNLRIMELIITKSRESIYILIHSLPTLYSHHVQTGFCLCHSFCSRAML